MENIEYAELLLDYDAVIWRVKNVSLLSKKGAILESVQNIYVKKPPKVLKATITPLLTHDELLGKF